MMTTADMAACISAELVLSLPNVVSAAWASQDMLQSHVLIRHVWTTHTCTHHIHARTHTTHANTWQTHQHTHSNCTHITHHTHTQLSM